MIIQEKGCNVVIGKKGSGKSTAAAAICRYWLKHKKGVVLSNLEIKGTYSYNPKELGLFYPPENSLVVIDEAGIDFNGRSWKNFSDFLIKFFKYQRHCKCTVVLFTQAWDIDITIKRLTDKVFYIRRFLRFFAWLREVKIKWIWTEPTGTDGSEYVPEMHLAAPIIPSSNAFYFMPKYWKIFDSFKLPSSQPWEKFCTLRE